MASVTRGIKTKLQLDGEQEFKDAISSINSGLGVLDSELRKIKAQYQDNADSIEALTATGDVLERKLYSQREAVETYRQQLEKLKADNGEANEETMKMEKKLNNAEAALYNTEAAIRKNNAALEEAKNGTESFMDKTKGLGDILGDIGNKFGVTLPDGMKTSLNGMAEFSASSVVAFTAVTAAVKAVVDTVVSLADITKEVAGYVDDLNTTATTSGIDTYTLQVLNYMEDLADTDVSTVTGSMTKLTKAMDNARNGTESTVEAFNQLGVSWEDGFGNLRDSQDVFWEAIDALGQIGNETERDAVAMDLFGKSAKELNTLIAVGSEGFDEFAKEAEDAGYILSDKQNKALNDYNDALDRATKQQDAMNEQLASIMAPALTELTEGWSNLKTEGLQLIIDSGIVDFLADLVEIIGYVVGWVGDLIEVINALLHPIDSLRELLGYSNTTLEENAALTKSVSEENKELTQSVNQSTTSLNNQTNTIKNTTEAVRELAIQMGYLDITEERLAELGEYSSASSERGSGFFGTYANYTKAEFKSLLEQNGITSASQISSILGEDAYRYYNASLGYNASGDFNYKGGLTWVGENGPELVSLPSGSAISTAQESRNAGTSNYYITIDAKSVKEFNDIVRIAQNSRVSARMRA